jgi:histidinol-phosphate aminotransferase
MYEIMILSEGAVPVSVPLVDLKVDLKAVLEGITPKTRMIFLNNPHNPAGTIIEQEAFENFFSQVPEDIVVVIDEAYIEFARSRTCLDSLGFIRRKSRKPGNAAVVALRTFSKAYGLAGLRIGYGIMPAAVSDFLNRIRQPFNTNTLAQTGALAALEDQAFLEESIALVHQELVFLQSEVEKLGLRFFPTETNYFLIEVEKNADAVFREMMLEGVIIRSMKSYGYPSYIRINVGNHQENVKCVRALGKVAA